MSLERTICCSINVQIWPVFCKFAYEFTLIAEGFSRIEYCIIYTVFDYRYSCSEKKNEENHRKTRERYKKAQ